MPSTSFNVAVGVGCVYILYKLSGTFIRNHFVAKLTALNELSEIGPNSTRKSAKLRGTAVICGGSIAGLLAAKVCSDHFESVIIVEAEEWVATSEGYTRSHRKELADKKRSHVAQYNAAHLFQPFLAAALVKWFPNLKEECEKLGGRIIPQKMGNVLSGLPLALPSYPGYDNVITFRMNRPGFETLLRRLVMNSCKNVKYMAGDALGLEKASGADNMITGVHVRAWKGEEITLPAVLAIGASSAGLRWLKDLATAEGNEAAVKRLDSLRETYNPKQAYRTCEFDVPPELIPRLMEVGFPVDWDLSGPFFTNSPDPKMDNKLFGITRKDHNYLECTIGGWSVSDPISSIQDIRSYVSSIKVYKPLPTWIYRVLDVLEENKVPLTVDYSRLGPAIYIRYNLYKQMPSNFIAMGDSVMRLNPVRGVGCTKACIEALTLNKLLSKCSSRDRAEVVRLPADFSKKFHNLQASRVGSDWNSYKAEDYAWESTVPAKGDDPKTFGKFDRAFGRLIVRKLLQNDNDFAVTVGYVRSYLAPFTDLFAPRILLKLLKVKLFDQSPLL